MMGEIVYMRDYVLPRTAPVTYNHPAHNYIFQSSDNYMDIRSPRENDGYDSSFRAVWRLHSVLGGAGAAPILPIDSA